MKAKRDIKPISYVKAHTAEIVSQVNKTRKPMYITQNGEAKAVIMDTESFELIRDSASLLKLLSFGESDIKAGRFKEQDDFLKSVENDLLK
jgi:prevent-host-death family protein